MPVVMAQGELNRGHALKIFAVELAIQAWFAQRHAPQPKRQLRQQVTYKINGNHAVLPCMINQCMPQVPIHQRVHDDAAGRFGLSHRLFNLRQFADVPQRDDGHSLARKLRQRCMHQLFSAGSSPAGDDINWRGFGGGVGVVLVTMMTSNDLRRNWLIYSVFVVGSLSSTLESSSANVAGCRGLTFLPSPLCECASSPAQSSPGSG